MLKSCSGSFSSLRLSVPWQSCLGPFLPVSGITYSTQASSPEPSTSSFLEETHGPGGGVGGKGLPVDLPRSHPGRRRPHLL